MLRTIDSSHDRTVEAPSASPMLSAFRRMGRRLRGVALSLLGDEDEADDALQEAFCRLWPRAPRIGSEDEAAALLTTTVRNVSIDALRRKQVAPTVRTEILPDQADDAEEMREREEQYRRVEEIIDGELSLLAQDILRRKEYRGQTFEQIAEELGMQPAAVRMQLSRARKQIRECYKRQTSC